MAVDQGYTRDDHGMLPLPDWRDKAPRNAARPRTRRQMLAVATRLREKTKSARNALQASGATHEDTAKHDAIIENMDRLIEVLRRDPTKVG